MTAADLAAAVKARRAELALPQTVVAREGGIDRRTLAGVEAATVHRPSPTTLDGLDDGLQWVTGTAARIFAAGVPEPRRPVVDHECPNCRRRGTCAAGSCSDRRVVVRRVLIDHLTAQQVAPRAFAELIEALVDDLVPREVSA